jgi:hypothetical protein
MEKIKEKTRWHPWQLNLENCKIRLILPHWISQRMFHLIYFDTKGIFIKFSWLKTIYLTFKLQQINNHIFFLISQIKNQSAVIKVVSCLEAFNITHDSYREVQVSLLKPSKKSIFLRHDSLIFIMHRIYHPQTEYPTYQRSSSSEAKQS